jgi:hypothetical protein
MVKLISPNVSGQQLTRGAGGAAQSIAQAGSAFRSVAQTANVVSELGIQEEQRVQALEVESNKRDASAYVNTALADFSIDQEDAFNERKLSGEDIGMFTKNTNESFNSSFQQLLNDAPNEFATNELMEKKGALRQKRIISAADYESGQKVKVSQDKLDSSLNRYVNHVSNNPDSLDARLNDVEGIINGATGMFTDAEKQERISAYKNDMLSAAADAYLFNEDIEAATDLMGSELAQNLDPAEYVRLGEEIIEGGQRKLAEQYIGNVVGGKAVYDAKNTASQKAYNSWYKKNGVNMTENQKVDMVGRTGSMPDLLLTEIRGSLVGGNISQKKEAANLIESFKGQNNNAMFDLTASEIASATEINALSNANVPNAEIESYLSKKGTTDAQARIKSDDFKDLADFDGAVKDYFDTSILPFGESAISEGMKLEHQKLSEFYFIEHGLSANDSKEAAATQMKRDNWGETSVGGVNRWQRLAPEKVYGNEFDPSGEWINDQLTDLLTSLPQGQATGDNVILEVNSRDVNKKYPSYNVFYRDEQGMMQRAKNDDETVVYQPDYDAYTRKQQKAQRKDGMLEFIDAQTRVKQKAEHLLNLPKWYKMMVGKE